MRKSQIKIETTSLFDRKRKRRISVTGIFNNKTGRFPVILFSPGSDIPTNNYQYLGKKWAHAGYICLFIEGQGECELSGRSEFWPVRSQDISFVIDSIATLKKRFKALKAEPDLQKIGLCGHSYGAHAALALSGARVYFPTKKIRPLALVDTRISAFIAISPPGPGYLGMRTTSYSQIRGPMLILSGSKDNDLRLGKSPQWRQQPFKGAKKKTKVFQYTIKGADHFSFIDSLIIHGTTFDLPNRDFLKITSDVTLKFWQAYLRGGTSHINAFGKMKGLKTK